jgi:hypothetical protein
MAVYNASPTPESPSKKRKVKTQAAKPWATCTKLFFKEWRKEDYLVEFNLSDMEWVLLDAQVLPQYLIC